MYAIMSGGVLLALCDKPRYVKRNGDGGPYVEAQEAEAIGVSVNGDLYNIGGGNAIPDAPEAVIRQQDTAEYVFRNRAKIEENEATQGAAVIDIENALCETNAETDERLTEVENALCELDAAINNG